MSLLFRSTFSPAEKLDSDKLKDIASGYMERIGFGNQPYLAYRNFDAAHPQRHILTTSIQDNGKRIPLHNLGRIQSEKARTEIEELFNLVKATGKDACKDIFTELKNIGRPVYGKSPTKESISKVVRAVTRPYKFTSIPELNAVLGQFHHFQNTIFMPSRMIIIAKAFFIPSGSEPKLNTQQGHLQTRLYYHPGNNQCLHLFWLCLIGYRD